MLITMTNMCFAEEKSFELGHYWRSLSTKYKHQINKEKDPNATNTQT